METILLCECGFSPPPTLAWDPHVRRHYLGKCTPPPWGGTPWRYSPFTTGTPPCWRGARTSFDRYPPPSLVREPRSLGSPFRHRQLKRINILLAAGILAKHWTGTPWGKSRPCLFVNLPNNQFSIVYGLISIDIPLFEDIGISP